MKRVVAVKLTPTPEAHEQLMGTLRVCNNASNHASHIARTEKTYNKIGLQKLVYQTLKERYGLGAQASLHAIRKTSGAYQTHWVNLKAGNYGKKGTVRWRKALNKTIKFRPTSAQPFDDRMLSWDHDGSTVSIWVIDTGNGKPGRIRVPFTGASWQLDLLKEHRQGETDLLARDGALYLVATIDQPAPPVSAPAGFIGVDMGIVKIASTATHTGQPLADWDGGVVTEKRKKNQRLRTRLQAKGTKSAKRRLKKRSMKEARFATDVNHQISKRIVTEAQRTGYGIAIEQLTGIRDRARLRKPQRVALHSWAFAQLGDFITYKASQHGVALMVVDPAYTSQTCSGCGVVAKSNRKSQAEYACSSCGVSLNADTNAAVNIARRGVDGWAVVNQPDVA